VPREVVEEQGEAFTRRPVGTGPFRLAEWIDNDSLRLDRFDDHWAGRAKIAGIKYRVIPEPLARRTEYMAGNLELCDVTQGVIPEWRESNHAEDLLLWPVASLYYYGFNLEKEGSPFAGFGDSARKLREALNHAIDREFICNRIVDGRYDPSNGIIPPGLPGHEALRPRFPRDIPKAKQLLAEAGHPNGVGLPVVELWFNPQGDNANIAQVIQQNLAEVGVRIELKQLDWAAFIKATDAGEPAFFRLGWVADYPDPENFLYFLFHSENKGPNGNVCFYGRPEVDELLDRANGILDPVERLRVLNEAEEKILADWPWLFIASIREALLVKPYVTNFKPMLLDDDSAGCTNVDWLNVDFTGGGNP
jgi:peptide/nickel transport system substrate-binding protein/oligopeptide transport system substrate-binding protein